MSLTYPDQVTHHGARLCWNFPCPSLKLHRVCLVLVLSFFIIFLLNFVRRVAFNVSSTPMYTKFCPPPHLLERTYYSWWRVSWYIYFINNPVVQCTFVSQYTENALLFRKLNVWLLVMNWKALALWNNPHPNLCNGHRVITSALILQIMKLQDRHLWVNYKTCVPE
jgi:hypothetical protein